MSIVVGSVGQHVETVQDALNAFGAQPNLVVDGIFGRNTVGALARFQVANGLPEHGAVDTTTAMALGLDALVAQGLVSPLDFDSIVAAVFGELRLRLAATDVEELSARRRRLRVLFTSITPTRSQEFRERLEDPTDELGAEFQGELHPATIAELLGLLPDHVDVTLVRRSVWELEDEQPWHPILVAYARAVRDLQQRAQGDETSWVYQAAIHGTASSPPARGWNQCQHGAWYFLPWHRLYLYYFERILRSVVVAQGGPDDWALPYWNYDAGGNSNTLPPSFRAPSLSDGSPNPLFVTNRRARINAGAGLPPAATSAATAMGMSNFLPPPLPGFGGGQTSATHHFFNAFGALERTPHNDVHVLVGGLMANPNTAALDPIFWLHHANIDRLWMEWNAGGGANPTATGWTGQTFELFDENGTPETRPLSDTNDPVGVLGYRYDTMAPAPPEPRVGLEAMSETPRAGSEPEMVGAADESVVLEGGSRAVDVPIDARAAQGALETRAADTGARLYLTLEHVDAEATPEQVYAVYVEAPGGRRHHVGNLALFGIEQLHEERGEEGPHHQQFVYDVSDVAAEVGGPGALEVMRVTFEQLTFEAGSADDLESVPDADVVPITVGRVTLRSG